MPAFAIPAVELKRDFVQRALGEDRKSSDFVPDSMLLRWFSEAYRELNRRVKLLVARHTATLAASAVQDAPADILDRLALNDQALRVKSAASGKWQALVERDWPYIQRLYPDLDAIEATGGPTDWTWDEREPTAKLLLLPPPQSAVAGGLAFDYVQDPGGLARIYDDDEATCGVTSADATVTLPAAAQEHLAAGDLFGVKAAAAELPTTWYRVADISAFPAIELAETYGGATDAAALFTLSQASAIETKRPGVARFAAVEYALEKYWLREGDQAAADRARLAWEAEVARIAAQSADRPGLRRQSENLLRHHAGLRR